MAKQKQTPPEAEADTLVAEEVAANPVESGLARISHYEQKLEEVKKYKEATIAGINDREGHKLVEKYRKEAKAEKVKVENERKALVGPLNEMVAKINAQAGKLRDGFKEVEDDLDAKSAEYERLVEEDRDRKAKELEDRYNDRMDRIATAGATWNGHSSYKVGEISLTNNELRSLSDEEFNRVHILMEEAGVEMRRIQREEEEKKEAERIAAEKAAEELAEAQRKLREEQEALEAQRQALEAEKERIAQEAIEAARLAKEAAELKAKEEAEAAKAKLFTDRFVDLVELKPSIQHNKAEKCFVYKGQKLVDESLVQSATTEFWAELLTTVPEKIAAIDKKIEEEAIAAQEKAAKELKEAEEAAVAAEKKRVEEEKKEKARLAQLKPDIDKFTALSQVLTDSTKDLEVKSDEAKKLLVKVNDQIAKLTIWITEKSQSL